jgi:3-hydroxybenzoate 6-monooxygenase
VLGEHVARSRTAAGTVDWDGALTAYQTVRPEHCRGVVTTSRTCGEL